MPRAGPRCSNGPDGRRTVRARAVVNAAGPWAESFLRGVAQPAQGEALATRHLRLVKGSHIVVPRLFTHDHAYIFQNPDKRIIFAIPYQDDFTLIGTTDIELEGDDPGAARIGDDEIDYLCTQASRYFEKPVDAGRRGLDLLGRASAARRRLGRPVGRDARLHARVQHQRRRRCCRCGAARSPPSASWPRTRPTKWAACSARPGRPGPKAPSWPAATCRAGSAPASRGPTTISSASSTARAGAVPLARRRAARAGWRAPTALASSSVIGDARSMADLGAAGGARPARARAALPARRGMGLQRRRRAVAPLQAGPAPHARRSASRSAPGCRRNATFARGE